jgi:hypothetical protein
VVRFARPSCKQTVKFRLRAASDDGPVSRGA